MSLQFTLIQETTSGREKVFEDILKFLGESTKNRVFYLTPEHMKFEMEMFVLNHIEELTFQQDEVAMMRLNVYSFRRLAWFLAQQTDYQESRHLSDVGQMMVIQKVLSYLKDDLTVYRGEVNRIGFMQKLKDLFNELINGNISSETLSTITDSDGDDSLLIASQKNKLSELHQIYAYYENWLANQKISKSTIYDDLFQQIQRLDLEHIMVVVDGFKRFNAGEQRVLGALLTKVPKMHLILTLDQPFIDHAPQWDDVFIATGTIYYEMYHFAKEQGIPVNQDIYGSTVCQYHPGIKRLDQLMQHDNLSQGKQVIDQSTQAELGDVVHLFKAETTYIEANEVANRIHQLVSKNNYRYQDIQVLMRDTALYQNSLIPALERNKTPYFLDEQETMDRHPLYRMLTAIYNIYQYNWRYQDVFNLLRSELLVPKQWQTSAEHPLTGREYRELIDRVENIVLKNGYEGKFWWNKRQSWQFRRINEDGEVIQTEAEQHLEIESNRIRLFLAQTLQPLFDSWDTESDTLSILTQFYRFLSSNHVAERLGTWRDDQLAEGDLQGARHHEQAWQTFVTILDEYVQLFEKEPFHPSQFFDLLTTAFQEAKFSIVPPTMDSVTISTLDRPRLNQKKVTFIVGLTKGALPKTFTDSSLMTQEDRELLEPRLNWNQKLSPSAKIKRNDEKFLAYKGFLSASEHLFLSYPFNDENDALAEASPYINWLVTECNLPIKKVTSDLSTQTFGGWQSQLDAFIQAKRQSQEEQVILSPKWHQLLSQITEKVSNRQGLNHLLHSTDYKNKVVNLPSSLAKELYGQHLRLSISQLEMYNRDPFSFFMRYGLRLNERDIFTLSPLEMGTYYHAVLDYVVKMVQKDQLNLGSLTEQELKKYAEIAFSELKQIDMHPEFTILTSSQIMNQLGQRMDLKLWQLLKQIEQQQKDTEFNTIETEKAFGFDRSYAYQLLLPDGDTIDLRGKIDRIDKVDYEGKTYLQIVDYKSNHNVKVDFSKIYTGRQLQLYTYLAVALNLYQATLSKDVLPFGAFYQNINLAKQTIKTQSEWDKKVTDSVQKRYQLSGYVLGDIDLLKAVDESFNTKRKSQVYHAALTQKDTFNKQNSYQLSDEEFQLMLAFVKERIQQTATKIKSGYIQLEPFKDDNFTLSKTAPYRSVSLFDVTEPEQPYREETDLKNKSEFFKQVKKDLQEGEEDNE